MRVPGRYHDRRGLYLQVRSASAKSWLLRYNRFGNGEHFMGLGSAADFSLEQARERAQAARQKLTDGIDPIEARLAERDARRKEAEENISFQQAAEEFLELHEDGWRNRKHRQQWRTTLKDYAYPALGARPIKSLDAAVINSALATLWSRVPATAGRVRNRIQKVLKWVESGKPLPAHRASQRTKHHPALAPKDIPAFMRELRATEGVSARALEFLTLCAARTNEIVAARWSEIDIAEKLWVISASRMKSARPHRVPLSDRAVEILDRLPRETGNPYRLLARKKASRLPTRRCLN